jgi:hypothetical protein
MEQLDYFVRNISLTCSQIRRIAYHEHTSTMTVYFRGGVITRVGGVCEATFEHFASEIEDTDCDPRDCLMMFFAENIGSVYVL